MTTASPGPGSKARGGGVVVWVCSGAISPGHPVGLRGGDQLQQQSIRVGQRKHLLIEAAGGVFSPWLSKRSIQNPSDAEGMPSDTVRPDRFPAVRGGRAARGRR